MSLDRYKYNELIPDTTIDVFYKRIKEEKEKIKNGESSDMLDSLVRNLIKVNNKVPEHIQYMLNESLITEGNDGGKFGYLGLNYQCEKTEWKEKLSKFFKEEDLHEFGIEEEAHITVMYGFLPEVKVEDIKPEMKDKIIFKEDIEFSGLSLFENDEYDVVKIDIESKKLHKYNKFFSEKFPFESDFDEYIPHLTIAYCKKGTGKYYVSGHTGKDLIELIKTDLNKCESVYYKWSDSEKNESIFKIKCD